MKTTKLTTYFLGMSLLAGLISCSKSDEPETSVDDNATNGDVYVLNQGNYYNGVEGSFNILNYNSNEAETGVFQKINQRSLGACPQCGVAYGSKIYIGVYESNTIEIINKNDYKSLSQIKLDETGVSGTGPRSMIATGGKVYISMFDGYVARLDTTSMQIEASVKVGPNPEIMALYNGKLYVPNSDGLNENFIYGKTASEIDLSSFTVSRTFEVPENPNKFMASENGLYLLCNGNYYDVAAKIYKINSDLSFTEIDNATVAEVCGDYICYVNDPFYGSGIADYRKYNLQTGKISDWEIEKPEYTNTIFYDRTSDKILIGSLKYYGNQYPSFDLPGYVAIYDSNGTHLKDIPIGSGPACFFTETK